MKCHEVEDLLELFFIEKLDAKTHQAVEEHLSLCTACAEKLADLSCSRDFFSHLDDIEIPESLHDEIMASVASVRLTENQSTVIDLPLGEGKITQSKAEGETYLTSEDVSISKPSKSSVGSVLEIFKRAALVAAAVLVVLAGRSMLEQGKPEDPITVASVNTPTTLDHLVYAEVSSPVMMALSQGDEQPLSQASAEAVTMSAQTLYNEDNPSLDVTLNFNDDSSNTNFIETSMDVSLDLLDLEERTGQMGSPVFEDPETEQEMVSLGLLIDLSITSGSISETHSSEPEEQTNDQETLDITSIPVMGETAGVSFSLTDTPGMEALDTFGVSSFAIPFEEMRRDNGASLALNVLALPDENNSIIMALQVSNEPLNESLVEIEVETGINEASVEHNSISELTFTEVYELAQEYSWLLEVRTISSVEIMQKAIEDHNLLFWFTEEENMNQTLIYGTQSEFDKLLDLIPWELIAFHDSKDQVNLEKTDMPGFVLIFIE